jgi:hypothetical protein
VSYTTGDGILVRVCLIVISGTPGCALMCEDMGVILGVVGGRWVVGGVQILCPRSGSQRLCRCSAKTLFIATISSGDKRVRQRPCGSEPADEPAQATRYPAVSMGRRASVTARCVPPSAAYGTVDRLASATPTRPLVCFVACDGRPRWYWSRSHASTDQRTRTRDNQKDHRGRPRNAVREIRQPPVSGSGAPLG